MHPSTSNSRPTRRLLGGVIGALASLSLLLSLGCAAQPDLATRLAEADRAESDRVRDEGRRPAAVVAFLGVEQGMTVVDLLAAGGYYSEVLAVAVGPEGRVYAQNTPFLLKMRGGANEKAISARLANDRLPNVARLDREINDLGLTPESIDLILTALNFHDIYNGRGPEMAIGLLEVLHGILAPNGSLAIIDHAGNPDLDNQKLHRIEEAKVIDSAEKAGFVVEATSDVLRHPEDDRTRFVFAEGLRGQTDRFVLKLRKAR